MRRRLALALALCLALAAPAAADTDPAVVARALERSPLYVDEAFQGALRPTERRELARAIEAAPRPVFVALVPLLPGDDYDGDHRRYLAVLHSRLDAPGVYVSLDDGYLVTRTFPEKLDEEVAAAATVANLEGDYDEPVGRTLQRFVGALGDPDVVARADRAAAALEGSGSSAPPASQAELEEGGVPTAAWLGGGAAVAALALLGTALLVRRRGARHAADAPPVLPARVFEHARTAQEDELREDAERELVALSQLLDAADAPNREDAQNAYQRALDAYAAARKTLAEARGTEDVTGAMVLVDGGRAALGRARALEAGRRPPDARSLCFFNPLHGEARADVRWERGLRVPACAECHAALGRGDAPDALRDGDRAYFESGSVWARTGYGIWDDDLAARVLRGER